MGSSPAELLSRLSVNIDCPGCGSNEFRPSRLRSRLLNLPRPFSVDECSSCGLRRLNPQPTVAAYELLYSKDYFTEGLGTNHAPFMTMSENKVDYFKEKLRVIEQLCPKKGKILDVGASMGHFIFGAKMSGWDVMGIDVSDWAIKYAREKFGVEIRKGEIVNADLPSGEFDVVTIMHTLEHLSNPRRALESINRVLKRGGLIAIEVPNQFNDLFTLSTLPYQLYATRGQPPLFVHTFFFTVRTLAHLVKTTGFEIVKLSTWRERYPISSSTLLGRKVKLLCNRIGQFFQMGEIIEVYARKTT